MKRHFWALLILVISVVFCSAQNKQKNPWRRALIPIELRPLLMHRLEEFAELHRQEKRARIFDYLYESQNTDRFGKYNDEQRQCIIEQIKANPMVNFTFVKTNTSTFNIDAPLDEKIWTVEVDAEFNTESGILRTRTNLGARYYNQNWFFSVPDFYTKSWFAKKNARADLSAEMKELLEVVEQPGSPVEVFDVSVKSHPKSHLLRDYRFKVRNKTKKVIVSYGYRFIEAGQTVFSPNDIKRGEFAFNDGFYVSGQLFCEEKERPVRLVVTYVKFNDGTEWISKLRNIK
jgi:hypothetical protein